MNKDRKGRRRGNKRKKRKEKRNYDLC